MTLRQTMQHHGTTPSGTIHAELLDSCMDEKADLVGQVAGYVVYQLECGNFYVEHPDSGFAFAINESDVTEGADTDEARACWELVNPEREVTL